MKTMIRILGVATAVAVVALVAAPADAGCLPNKTLTSWTGSAFGYFYVNLPAGQDNSTVVGRFWQTGNRAAGNEGSFDDTFWLRPYPPAGPGKYYILGELGAAEVAGCPAGNLTLTVDTASGHNLSISVPEAPATVFDLGANQADFNFGLKPRLGITSSSRTGSTVNLTASLTAQQGGVYTLGGTAVAVVPSYRVMVGSGASDPGPNPANYVAGQTLPAGTPTPLTVDCTDGISKWVATQSIVDGQFADFVGPRTQVSCSPAMADPKFKNIDRPIRPNPRSER